MSKNSKLNPFFVMQIIGKRARQEDSYGICYEPVSPNCSAPNCFILADGMGGHSGGSVASQTAIDSVKLVIENSEVFDEYSLEDALSSANLNIAECIKVNNDLEGMGTTLVVLIIKDQHVYWVSVGDSPLYSLDMNNKLRLLNEDHSMKPVLDQLVESGVLSREHPDYRGKVSQLRSAVIGAEIELYDLNATGRTLADSQYLVLSTDGLDTLSEDEVTYAIVANKKKGPKEIATALINAIDRKRSPKQDNTTLIVIDTLTYKKT
jgi:protein phosphatase